MRWLAFLLASCAFGASVADLQATAKKIQAQRSNPSDQPRDSLIIEFKHQLRDWVESRLTGDVADQNALISELNTTLAQAGLMCTPAVCIDQDLSGYLSKVELGLLSPGWLLLTTHVGGVNCGNADSVYLYENLDNRWVRRIEREHEEGGTNAKLSEPDAMGRRLFLTTGISVSCTSIWQTLYYSLSRLTDRVQTLLEDTHWIMGDGELKTAVDPDGMRIDFNGFVLRYKTDGDNLRRVAPIATFPTAFVEQWLTRPWSEIAESSDPSLADWQQRLHEKPSSILSFLLEAESCPERLATWQVIFDTDDGAVYFLVEEKTPSNFRMLAVSTTEHPGCSR